MRMMLVLKRLVFVLTKDLIQQIKLQVKVYQNFKDHHYLFITMRALQRMISNQFKESAIH